MNFARCPEGDGPSAQSRWRGAGPPVPAAGVGHVVGLRPAPGGFGRLGRPGSIARPGRPPASGRVRLVGWGSRRTSWWRVRQGRRRATTVLWSILPFGAVCRYTHSGYQSSKSYRRTPANDGGWRTAATFSPHDQLCVGGASGRLVGDEALSRLWVRCSGGGMEERCGDRGCYLRARSMPAKTSRQVF
jgi:hypothetical protein